MFPYIITTINQKHGETANKYGNSNLAWKQDLKMHVCVFRRHKQSARSYVQTAHCNSFYLGLPSGASVRPDIIYSAHFSHKY